MTQVNVTRMVLGFRRMNSREIGDIASKVDVSFVIQAPSIQGGFQFALGGFCRSRFGGGSSLSRMSVVFLKLSQIQLTGIAAIPERLASLSRTLSRSLQTQQCTSKRVSGAIGSEQQHARKRDAYLQFIQIE
ncbi:MAG TPA: hypothetical protein VIM63_02910 [Rhodoferax sp.]